MNTHDLHIFRSAAREAERARLLSALRAREADVLLRLADAVRAAAAINSELVAVEEAERDLTPGTIHDVLCWPWLLTSTPAMTAHLDHWLTTVRGYGFDV